MMEEVKSETEQMKTAWIDEENHVVSFHEVPNARCYKAPETEFWERIQEIVKTGYAIQ